MGFKFWLTPTRQSRETQCKKQFGIKLIKEIMQLCVCGFFPTSTMISAAVLEETKDFSVIFINS